MKEITEKNKQPTTLLREWLGAFGSAVWLFFLMYGYDNFINGRLEGVDGLTPYQNIFKLILALSIAVFALLYNRNPEGLSKIAFYTAPAAIVLTATFAFLPPPFGLVFYLAAPVFFAPAVARRVYGFACMTKTDKYKLTKYISAIALSIGLFVPWILIGLPKEVAFLVPALFAAVAWLGLRRKVPATPEYTAPEKLKTTKRFVFGLIAAGILLFSLNILNLIIRMYAFYQLPISIENIYTLLGIILPPVSFLVYAFLSDKGYERIGFAGGMGLFLICIILALLPAGTRDSAALPLLISGNLFGSYTQFLMLTVPFYFLKTSKRPVFTASLVAVLFLVGSACERIVKFDVLSGAGIYIVVSAAILAVAFIILGNYLLERFREKTLAAALYALLYGTNAPSDSLLPAPDTAVNAAENGQNAPEALFSAEEREVAVLLTEGLTQYEISRRLHTASAEVGSRIKSIRDKMSLMSDPDPVVAAANAKYGLTRRETDMLRCLLRGMSNAEIAAELFLSDETVRTHIRNLLKKLNVHNRSEIASWLKL